MSRTALVTSEPVIEVALEQLAKMAKKSVIREKVNVIVKKLTGKPCSARSFERIMARARVVQMEEEGKTKRQMRHESRRALEALIADPKVNAATKVRAIEAHAKLMALNAPQRVVMSGTGEGGAIKTDALISTKPNLKDLSDADLAALESLAKKAGGAAATQGDEG